MGKYIAYPLLTVLTSFYFFPFVFTFLPGANTKMIMAALGLMFVLVQTSQKKSASLGGEFLSLTVYALIVSLVAFISITLNETHDYAFVTYFISMWVWLGGAYTVVKSIKIVHDTVSVTLIGNYLTVVCVAQCILAFVMDINPTVKDFVDSFLAGEGYMGKNEGRLYGIGCALDVAGLRFSTVLIMISHICCHLGREELDKYLKWYMAAFVVIVLLGSMISRTTTIGAAIALVYALYASKVWRLVITKMYRKFFGHIFLAFVIGIPVVVHYYQTDRTFQKNVRFAFEGFFNLAEEGTWETNSTDILQNMVRFPKTFHTWCIGDGYFENPSTSENEPYYVGKTWGGFYQDTDIGYLRYIFYFGLTGLFAFCLVFFRAYGICRRRFPQHQTLFLMLLIMNFIGWLKVSTDLFLVFGLFLCLSAEEEEEYNKQHLPIEEES